MRGGYSQTRLRGFRLDEIGCDQMLGALGRGVDGSSPESSICLGSPLTSTLEPYGIGLEFTQASGLDMAHSGNGFLDFPDGSFLSRLRISSVDQ